MVRVASDKQEHTTLSSGGEKGDGRNLKAMYAVVLRSGVQYAARHRKLVKIAKLLSPFFVYLAISCLLLQPPSISALRNDIFSNGGDPQQFVWFLNWWPYALTHHLNPFVTNFAWYPHGYNLTWSTSVAGLALVMAPITLLGGAILSFNLIALFAPVLGALSCFWLVYSITKRYLPSLLSGYIYGFSTFEMGQILGHPQIYVNFPVPLIALLGWLYFKARIRAVTFGVLSAVLFAFQFGVSTEIFATFLIFATLALAIFYILSPPGQRKTVTALSIRLYGSVVAALVLVSPYLYYMAKGYQDVPDVVHPLDVYSTNLLNFLIPSPVTLVGGRLASGLSIHFTGNISEEGAYIGLPFAALLTYIAVKFWRRSYMLALTILLALIMLASMGPRLRFVGHIGYLPLPWIIPAHLPLIRSALPVRFSMYAFLVMALIIGTWLSFEASTRNRSYRYVVVLIAIACIVPASSTYYWQKEPVPSVLTKAHVASYIPKGSNIIILPYERNGSSVYYQYASDMWFTQTGEYVGFVPGNYAYDPVVEAFSTGVPGSAFVSDLKRFCAANKITKIVYLPQTPSPLSQAINSVGWPVRTVGSTTIVTVQQTKP